MWCVTGIYSTFDISGKKEAVAGVRLMAGGIFQPSLCWISSVCVTELVFGTYSRHVRRAPYTLLLYLLFMLMWILSQLMKFGEFVVFLAAYLTS